MIQHHRNPLILQAGVLIIFLTLLPCLSRAADYSIEKQIQKDLLQTRRLLLKIEKMLINDNPVTGELSRLKGLVGDIRSAHLLLKEQFREREEKANRLGPRAVQRHNLMSESYLMALEKFLDAIEEFLVGIENLSPGENLTPGENLPAGEDLPTREDLSLSTLKDLINLLEGILPKRRQPIFGSLPYRNLSYMSREPTREPGIVPSYRGVNTQVSPDDLAGTPEAPISRKIAEFAGSLDWNPVSIYEWVKNTIETEWYWGCMKGAEETLSQKSGNDTDQAALLVALLRASGFPSRYVRGVIEFFPDMEKAKNLTGIRDELDLARFFSKAGIPCQAIITGGRITNIHIEHTWVETLVPYDNYRGAIIDEHGKTWIALDTSIKASGYTHNNPVKVPDSFPLSTIRKDYLSAFRETTPLEYLKERIQTHLLQNHPGIAYDNLLSKRTLIPETMDILPASLQFREIAVTHEYTRIPEELMHKVRFMASGEETSPFFDITLEAYRLSNRSIALTYEPETVEDQEIMNAYGGLGNTPAYLIRLRPVLTIDRERLAVGTHGLPMGRDYTLSVELISPNGTEQFINTHIMGNLSVMGIVSQNAIPPEAIPFEEKDAERLLYEEALSYINRWNMAEEELSSLLHINLSHPVPTIVTTGSVIDVTYLLDTPHRIEWKGVYVDADLRAVETAYAGDTNLQTAQHGTSPDTDDQAVETAYEVSFNTQAADLRMAFMQLSSLQGSILENLVLEEDFQVEGISTAKLFCLTNEDAIPILTIDHTNIEVILPTITLTDCVKEDITNAVNQGLTISIPGMTITHEDWEGTGYIKEDHDTGESGWMLSGMIAGGMSAWGADRWPENLADKLRYPFSELPSFDPLSAQYIQKIPATDLQKGTVGEPLSRSLQVIVQDKEKRPVKGAEVTFNIRAGEGMLREQGDGSNPGQSSITVKTGKTGIASAELILGQKTGANPTTWWETGYTYSQQVGENIVDASLTSGVHIAAPFTAFGFPGGPFLIRKIHGDEHLGNILSFAGFIAVSVEDKYGNPVSNLPVDFKVLPAIPGPCSNPNQEYRQALFIKKDDPCNQVAPLYGECKSATDAVREITSSKGASVHIIFGDMPDAEYPISATCPVSDDNILTATFHLHTHPFGNCDGDSSPESRLILYFEYLTDRYGNIQNTGKVNTSIPLTAKAYMIMEGGTEKDGEIIGSREYLLDANLQNVKVMFDDLQAGPAGNGIYTVMYPLGGEPKMHEITLSGSAALGETIITAKEETIRVFGVDIEMEPAITEPEPALIALIDPDGYTIEDTVITYKIMPPEYIASTASMVIMKDGEPLTYIATETRGEGKAAIPRGFRFDLAGEYEYALGIILNVGTKVRMTSNKIQLNPTVVRIRSIYIEDARYNVPVPFGGSPTARAITEPEGRSVLWSVIEKDEGVKAEIDPLTGVIRASDNSQSGYITICAMDKEAPHINKKEMVQIGCPECPAAGQCYIPGAAFIELSSIHMRLSLGRAKGGYPAGEIFLRAEYPSPALATPSSLTFSSVSKEPMEVLYDEDGSISQILAPETLVDIQVNDEFSYDIRFYRPEQIAGKSNTFYDTGTATGPFVSWHIENPDASPYITNRLKITESKGDTTRTYEYMWDPNQDAWSLNKGNGLVIETRGVRLDAGTRNRIITHTVKDASGNIASIIQSTYHRFPWGEELIERIEDPEGAALKTTMAYYDDRSLPGNYGRLHLQINPDGSWIRYAYDEQGRTIVKASPWLDSSVDAPADQVHTVYYDYTPVDPEDARAPEYVNSPRTVIEKIKGIIAGKTYYAYLANSIGDRIEIIEQCRTQAAPYGDPANRRTITTYYPSDTDLAESGSIKSILYPDGRLDTYIYEYGTFILDEDPALCGFFQGQGSDILETVVHGTADHPNGIPFKTTSETSIQDEFGRERMREVYVYNGSGYERIQWTVQYLDEFGRVTKTFHSDGTHTENTWGCCVRESDTDSRGITRIYIYDDLQRLETQIKEGISSGPWPAQSDIHTTYTYDAMGRKLTETISAEGLSLIKRNVYDKAGRLLNVTDTEGLTTSYRYGLGGLIITVTRPGGSTEIKTSYPDGSIKSITGTGVISTYYEYGINPDGTQWTKVYTGGINSPRWEKTTTDILGRTIRVEKPGFDNLETEENFYNTIGQLIKTSKSGQAGIIYEYDDLGARIRTGLDINYNGSLDMDSNDRINENENRFIFINEVWWEENIQRVYAREFDANATITGIQRTRITGPGSGGNTEENIYLDIHGNQTVTKVFIDRDNKTETSITNHPDSITGEVSVNVNGLLMSSKSKTGINVTYGYDALGRRTGITDPRTGKTTTHYNDKGHVDYVEDPAGNRTRYEYDPNTGQKIVEINALDKVTRFSYNNRDQVTHTWGDSVYPVMYVYDSYGQMSQMHTCRNGTNWSLETWPADAGTGDVTRWHYQEATGLLTAKEDASGKSITYTYTFGGKLATRTWARTSGNDPLVTTYSYSPVTGELLGIDYSDSTPDITFTYDRLGRQKTITDAVGTRIFTYNNTLQLESEIITGLYDKVIIRTYEAKNEPKGATNVEINGEANIETQGLRNSETNAETNGENKDEINVVPGRTSGFTLGTDSALSTDHALGTDHAPGTDYTGGTSPTLEKDYEVTYGYDDMGHHFSVGWNIGGTLGTTTYFYLPDSDLLYQLITDNQQQTTYSYKPHRDLRTQVKNKFNTLLISQYDYEYDPLGRRISAANSGQAFSAVNNAFNLYRYNDRNELIESSHYLGSDISDTNNPVKSEYRAYKYDSIGNRRESTIAKGTGSYTTNELNQYTHQTLPANGINSFIYDDDGNLTGIINNSVENPSENIKYTYNAENRLIAVEPQYPADGDKKLEFTYDYMGRRVRKKVYILNSGLWTVDSEILFIYDGWNMISEITIENENQTTKYYVWGLDLSQSIQGAGGIGGLLASVDPSSPTSYYFMYDVNGNVGQLLDANNGDISARYEYDPYGKIIKDENENTYENPFRFSNKYYDDDTELTYYGYRYYSPEIGRWLSKDPIGEIGGIHIYSFVINDPINQIDILGKTSEDFWRKIKGEQIPKAVGISEGGLLVIPEGRYSKLSEAIINLKFKGFSAGYETGIYFFPDSCEIAAYSIKAGILKQDSDIFDIIESAQGNESLLTTFETPRSFEKYLEENKKKLENEKETGAIITGGLAIEYAIYYGNPRPGAADARSFTGIISSHQLAFFDKSASVYKSRLREGNFINGNWIGGTYGIIGIPGFGYAHVYWDLQFITGNYITSVIRFEEAFGSYGTCMCCFLTRLMK